MTERRPICPTCNKTFAHGDRCPIDGSVLVPPDPAPEVAIGAIPRPSRFALRSGTTSDTELPLATVRPAAEALARLETAIARLGSDYEPPPGWQARVLAAVAEPPRRHRWPLFSLPLCALAAAAVVWLRTGAEVVTHVEVVRADRVSYRGAEGEHRWLAANIDDHVHVVASGSRAVRIYHDGALLVTCARAAPTAGCSLVDAHIELDAQLRRPGEYTVLVFDGDPPAPGDLDGDKAAALRANLGITEQQVRVQ